MWKKIASGKEEGLSGRSYVSVRRRDGEQEGYTSPTSMNKRGRERGDLSHTVWTVAIYPVVIMSYILISAVDICHDTEESSF